MSGDEVVGQRAAFRTGVDSHGPVGRVIGYTEQPTYVLVLDDGTRSTWVAGLLDRVLTCSTCDSLTRLVELGAEFALAALARHHTTGCPDWPNGRDVA